MEGQQEEEAVHTARDVGRLMAVAFLVAVACLFAGMWFGDAVASRDCDQRSHLIMATPEEIRQAKVDARFDALEFRTTYESKIARTPGDTDLDHYEKLNIFLEGIWPGLVSNWSYDDKGHLWCHSGTHGCYSGTNADLRERTVALRDSLRGMINAASLVAATLDEEEFRIYDDDPLPAKDDGVMEWHELHVMDKDF